MSEENFNQVLREVNKSVTKLESSALAHTKELERSSAANIRQAVLFEAHVKQDENMHNEYLSTLEKISNQTASTQECITKLDKKIDLHILKTELELKQIRELDKEQNELLDEHSKHSNQLEKDNHLREVQIRHDLGTRLERIEKPREWLKMTGKVLLWVSSAAGALYGAYEFLSFIRPFIGL